MGGRKFNKKFISKYLKWSEEDDKLLKEIWKTHTDEQLCTIFDRTLMSIKIRRSKLKLRREIPTKKVKAFEETRAYKYYMEMQRLIKFCESNPSPPKLDRAKARLLKLSNFR